jgi:cytoskeletal protein RodZ
MSADRTTGDFGSKLRAARERRGISLRQIANATKISVSVLEALERNDISRLPGGIFGRAFVRSYAIEVGLDPETTIQDFIAQFPSDVVTAGHPTSERIEDHEAHESDRRMASTFVRLVAISVPIAAAVVYFGIAGRRAVQNDVAPSVPVEATAPAPETTPSREVPATPAPATTSPGSPGPPATTPPPPAAAAPAADEAALKVGLAVTRPCWVTATVDGQRTLNRLLQAGERITVDVRKEMVLTPGDASAVTLTLNGAAAKALGNAGEVVTVRLSPANFKNYLQNR